MFLCETYSHFSFSLLTMSTVKLLKSEIELSLLFWTEARNLFFSVFMNQLFFPFFGLLSRSAMEKVESIFKRLISILFCFDVFIIDQNIQTIDSFILFQSELSLFRRGEKRSSQLDAGETFDFEDDDSGSGSGSSSANEDSDPSSFGNNSAPSSVAFLTDSRSSKTSSSSSTVRFKKKLASAPSLFSRRLSWLKMTSSHAAKEPKLDSITATLEFNFTPMKKLDEVDSHFDLERVLLQRISARFFLLSKNLKHYDSSNHSLAELLNKCKSAFLGIIRDMQILRHSSQDHGYFLSYKPESNTFFWRLKTSPLILFFFLRLEISPTFPETSPSDEMTNFLHLNSSELEMKNPSWSNLFYFTVLNSHTVIGYHPASKQKIFSFLPSVSCNENSASSVAIIDLVNLFGTLKANAVVSPLNFSDIHAIEDLIHSTLDLNEREPSKSRNSPSSMSFMKDAAFRSASRTDLSTPESYMNVFNLPFGYRLAEESLKIPILDIESVNILFSVLDTSNVLILLTILFAEWRVIIFSQSQTLSQVVVHSIFGLLYPFSWQHIYVPLLPKEGASILLLPCPYIISMHSSLKNEVCVPNGVAVIDLDHNKIAYPSGKIPAIPVDYKQKMLKAFSRYQEQAMLPISVRNFPSDLLSYSISGRSNISYDSYVHPSLRRLSYNVIAMRLHDNVSSENTEGIVSLQILQDNILQIFASLFYRYRLFLKDDSDSPFDVGAFISHVREEIVGFMDFFVRTKMFFDFIRTRIEARMSDIDDTRFEHYVLRNIVHKYSFIRSHDLKDLKGSWYVLKGRSWKKRYVSLIRSVFTVHKSKRLQKYIKLQIDLSPTSYTIDSACPIEDASGKWFYVTIKAMNGDSPSSVLRMRCVSPAIQTEWIDAMNSRVLDLDIRHAYNELSKKISHPISRI